MDGLKIVRMSVGEIRIAVRKIALEVLAQVQTHQLETLYVLGVLQAGSFFAVDLVRVLLELNPDLSIQFEFIDPTNYSNEQPDRLRSQPKLIVDTISDTGKILLEVYERFSPRIVADSEICWTAVLLKKPQTEAAIDFYGREIPNEAFAVGYGLDFGGEYRTLEYIMW